MCGGLAAGLNGAPARLPLGEARAPVGTVAVALPPPRRFLFVADSVGFEGLFATAGAAALDAGAAATTEAAGAGIGGAAAGTVVAGA